MAYRFLVIYGSKVWIPIDIFRNTAKVVMLTGQYV
jgi:hypothetical protein